MKRATRFALTLLLGLLLLKPSAKAEVVLSNLYFAYNYDYNLGIGRGSGTFDSVAHSFYTGSHDGMHWQINSITLLMDEMIGNPAPFQLSIYSDADDAPFTHLATLNGPTSPDGYGAEHTFTGNLTLTPETQYWIVASAPTTTSGSYWWGGNLFTSFADFAPGWGTTYQNAIGLFTSGEWNIYSASSGSVGYLFFEIDATPTAIPEPSTLLLLSTFGVGLLWHRGRRRRIG